MYTAEEEKLKWDAQGLAKAASILSPREDTNTKLHSEGEIHSIGGGLPADLKKDTLGESGVRIVAVGVVIWFVCALVSVYSTIDSQIRDHESRLYDLEIIPGPPIPYPPIPVRRYATLSELALVENDIATLQKDVGVMQKSMSSRMGEIETKQNDLLAQAADLKTGLEARAAVIEETQNSLKAQTAFIQSLAQTVLSDLHSKLENTTAHVESLAAGLRKDQRDLADSVSNRLSNAAEVIRKISSATSDTSAEIKLVSGDMQNVAIAVVFSLFVMGFLLWRSIQSSTPRSCEETSPPPEVEQQHGSNERFVNTIADASGLLQQSPSEPFIFISDKMRWVFLPVALGGRQASLLRLDGVYSSYCRWIMSNNDGNVAVVLHQNTDARLDWEFLLESNINQAEQNIATLPVFLISRKAPVIASRHTPAGTLPIVNGLLRALQYANCAV